MSNEEKILVVDDDVTTRLLLRAALRKAGFQVSLAEGGLDALAQARSQRFDLVMLDVAMPDMSGFEVCATLRAELDPLLPILMVTGMDDVPSVECAFQMGATDFIAKPIYWAVISHRVRYLLKGHAALQNLAGANARIAAILNAVPDLLFELDLDGRYISYHAPGTELLAVPAHEFIGKTVAEVMPQAMAKICMEALQEANSKGVSIGRQIELQLTQGRVWFELSVSKKAVQPGESTHFIVLSRDITRRKAAEQEIQKLAFYDGLTGLANRHAFMERLGRELKRAEHKGSRFGVLFMDLDDFKRINDTLGHDAGDLALRHTAAALTEAVRSVDLVSRDTSTLADIEIARLGGDEFTALILELKQPEDAMLVANRILELMRRPFQVGQQQLRLTTSIGIALYPDDGADAVTLLKHADSAMYLAKDSGRDQCKFYNAALTEIAARHMALVHDLQHALERNEFELHFQPQVDAKTGRLVALEALIRWARPGHGMVQPSDFIGAAEACGMIISIGQWVLRTACAQLARWHQMGHPLRIAVNLSPVQFKDPALTQVVQECLTVNGLSADYLELEVTESTLMDNMAATVAILTEFQQACVHIALDDFGTGYSSLSYLKRMPVGALKIDQSFVRGLPDDQEDLAMVRAILAMTQSLDLCTVAEGVETAEQADLLTALGCDLLQGFYFSKPVSAPDIDRILKMGLPNQRSGNNGELLDGLGKLEEL
ncbi:MAG: diguanylate cyclase [Comamonadaceae bacterium CG_4_9_14_3_um_filter_60_33]|nr:MAG: diguanylate cyclase [Comamonadaceae bacterium CG_4_10_14_3_um_filter_60_42]PJB41366.1 MAG: diguanylate cyclase [Comamonadaceae bacterium CG_4_9_14_3_um_filter_60_33]